MLEICLSLLLVLTSGEYLQSEFLSEPVRKEQHWVGTFRHPRATSLSIGQHVSKLGRIALLFESHGVDCCLGCLELLELNEETCVRGSCLDRLIVHLNIWARNREGLVNA